MNTEDTDTKQMKVGMTRRIARLNPHLGSGKCQGVSQSAEALREGRRLSRNLETKAFLRMTASATMSAHPDVLPFSNREKRNVFPPSVIPTAISAALVGDQLVNQIQEKLMLAVLLTARIEHRL
jgi:hypothetical protein